MALNLNELILDRVRSLTAHDLGTNQMLFRLTSLEDPTITCTAEGDEVTDAVGARITTMYRAKAAEFSATNSLFSLDLAAAQFGATKQIADTTNTIIDSTYEILTIGPNAGGGTADGVVLAHKAVAGSITNIYSIAQNQLGTEYAEGASVSTTEFVVNNTGATTVIETPTGLTGKIFVEYQFENSNANKVLNSASQYPEACSVIIYAWFRDVCNENIKYSGKILCPRAKLNPEQVEIALTSTGKHAFDLQMNKSYCAEEGEDELFTIIISEE